MRFFTRIEIENRKLVFPSSFTFTQIELRSVDLYAVAAETLAKGTLQQQQQQQLSNIY